MSGLDVRPHAESASDPDRDAWLSKLGYRVVRFLEL
ncbi:endonuclease domain-containing protein [Methylobacterium sp. Leaf118]|nr:endonuclease domain-containing protein [Methylobacterium sp. Leaf118]